MSDEIGFAGMAYPKQKTKRNEAYRRYVTTFPCAMCGIEGYSQAAHPNTSKYGKGMGLKADDMQCIPLCGPRPGVPGCHHELDQGRNMTKEERRDFENLAIAKMRYMAFCDGWFDKGAE